MTQALCRQALETKLSAWAAAQVPAIPVAYENVAFSPPVGVYVRAFLLPIRTISLTLDRLHRRYKGLFQVTLCMPINTGAGAAEALVSSLNTAFPLTPPIPVPASVPTLNVYIVQPMSAAQAPQEPERYVVPVTCAYEAHAI